MALRRVIRLRYAVRDTLDEAGLRTLVQRAVAGGAALDQLGPPGERTVVWDDFGDQALVHVDSVVVRVIKRFIVTSVDLETEQTGRAPLIVTLAFGTTQDGAGLVAATDTMPRGHPLLAARWGRVLQDTVWSALLDVARAHAEERGHVPLEIHALDRHLRFGAVPALALGQEALRTFERAFPGRAPGAPGRGKRRPARGSTR